MSLLKNINLNGTLLEIADTTARETADSALSKANEAQKTADSKALITYNESEMTMNIK